MTAEGVKETVTTPLVDQRPPQTSQLEGHAKLDLKAFETFFRRAGYIPFVSSGTGPVRSVIGVIGVFVNAVCLPIFAILGQQEHKEQSMRNLIISARWILRGFVESKPFVGNALTWSWDSFNDRLDGKKYLSDSLYECRFFPIVSMVTGALRAIRGAAGTAVGAAAQVVFAAMKRINFSAGTDDKILVAHKFVKESFYEIPQGIFEMIPLCDSVCPPLAHIAEGYELKKGALWQKQPHQE